MKRMSEQSGLQKEALEKLSKALADQGLLVEAGWVGLRAAVVDRNASDTQLEEMRIAFFAGAQHLFASIMTILEPGEEPTEKDMERLSLINNELRRFADEYKIKYLQTPGARGTA